MIEVVFPEHRFKIKEEGGKEYIFDEVRKQWLFLTPEEWVRQNFLQYLIKVKQYPASLIAVEREIAIGDVRRRYDIVVYNNDEAWLVVECKEMEVKLTEKVLQQVLNYNQSLQVKYIVITNGRQTYGLSIAGSNYSWLTDLPSYS